MLAELRALVIRKTVTDQSLKRSPLYAIQKGLGARFVPFAGWEMPVQFKGIVLEHHAVRQQVGLFDVTHMGRLRVTGPNALASVDRLVTNSLDHAPDGRAVYGCCCHEAGGILDDLICYRESSSSIFVICNASNRDKIRTHVASNLGSNVNLADVSDETALLALQGPNAFSVLEKLGAGWVHALSRMGFGVGDVAGMTVTVAKTGYTGELGVEIVCPRDRLEKLYVALLDAGRELGIEPTGLGARDTLRLEARLSLYGNEIDESTNPLEAGLGWTVKLDKNTFIGKGALEAVRRTGPQRLIVGLEMLGHGVARHAYPIVNETRRPVGVVTSGAPSPTLAKNIALAYVPLEMAAVGTRLQVDCRGKLVDATVVPTPFYKRPSVG
jgi:aminomethyltransferase